MICKSCGSVLRDDARFCGICGLAIEEENEVTEKPQLSPINNTDEDEPISPYFENPQPPRQKLSFGIEIMVICVVLVFIMSVVCGVFAGLYFSERKNNSSPTRSYAVVVEDTQW